MMRSTLGLILFAMSCATTGASKEAQVRYVADPNKAAEASTVVVCENEVPTGSNIAETRCRRVDDMAADRRRAQEMGEEVPRHAAPRSSR